MVEDAKRIAAAAGMDVCGIEYVVDERDGLPYFYDLNALSNFVADAQNVIGFDPFVRLVDYLELRAASGKWRDSHSARHSSLTTRHSAVEVAP